MARPLRIILPGVWYHITARGNDRRRIFADDRDRVHFLELLAEMAARFQISLHAYVLMDNHYHLLLEISRPNLSRAVQWLNVSHSAWFNRRHRRGGHLFQGRFKSIVVEPPSWGLSLSAYIHLNPVRVSQLRLGKAHRQNSRQPGAPAPSTALVQQRRTILRTYRWSSYRAYVGTAALPDWLCRQKILALGGGPAKQAAPNYRLYVERQIREGLPEKPWEQLTDQILLGGEKFLKAARDRRRTQIPSAARQPRWARAERTLKEIISAVEKTRGERYSAFKDRHGDPGRDQILYLARRRTALSLADLATAMNLKTDATVSMAVKRYEMSLRKNDREKDLTKKLENLLNVGS